MTWHKVIFESDSSVSAMLCCAVVEECGETDYGESRKLTIPVWFSVFIAVRNNYKVIKIDHYSKSYICIVLSLLSMTSLYILILNAFVYFIKRTFHFL